MAKIYLSKDFKEFIGLLNKHQVKFLIVGGYAVGFHGYVRATGDIDLMTSVSGLSFDQSYTKKEKTMIDGVEVPFIDLESLKINKASTNRNKDLGDLENLP
ncbi:MAG: hypothetical protein WD824_06030 [Cyclobacteriaceae bacterium]